MVAGRHKEIVARQKHLTIRIKSSDKGPDPADDKEV